jgi:hypothetical protein
MENMERLIASLDRVAELKAANAKLYLILGEESNIKHFAQAVRNDVIFVEMRGFHPNR